MAPESRKNFVSKFLKLLIEIKQNNKLTYLQQKLLIKREKKIIYYNF